MLTLKIDGDKIVSQTQAEDHKEPITRSETSPEPINAMRQNTTQKTSTSSNGASPEPENVSVDFASILGSGQFENLAAIQKAQLEAFSKATHTFMEGLTTINREAAEFRTERARTFVEDSNAMPSLADWSKIWNFQLTYTDRAAQAYMDEAAKLFDLGVKIAQESMVPLQESTTKAIDELLKKPE